MPGKIIGIGKADHTHRVIIDDGIGARDIDTGHRKIGQGAGFHIHAPQSFNGETDRDGASPIHKPENTRRLARVVSGIDFTPRSGSRLQDGEFPGVVIISDIQNGLAILIQNKADRLPARHFKPPRAPTVFEVHFVDDGPEITWLPCANKPTLRVVQQEGDLHGDAVTGPDQWGGET